MSCTELKGRQSQGKTIEETLVNIREAMALGAQPHAILLGVVWKSIKIAAVGCCLGLGAALRLNRLLGSILFEVQPADPAALGIVVAILGAVAFAACWLPAREATRVDPVKALRSQ